MNKSLNWTLLLMVIGILVFFGYDWQRKKTGLTRTELTNGWYKYSSDKFEFEYPKKLRSCYECSVTTGNVYTVLTDGAFILMFMSNQNSSHLISVQNKFAFPEKAKEKFIREEIDQLVINENRNPTDSFVVKNLKIEAIDYIPEKEAMDFKMEILGKPINAIIKANELDNCCAESWKFWSLKKEKGRLKKAAFGLESGRFFLQEEKEEIFFELQKIRRSTLYTFKEDNLREDDLFRFYKSIKMKS